MKKKIWFFLVGISVCSLPLYALSSKMGPSMNLPFEEQDSQDVRVHNRIVLKMNGNVITVMDVARRMDLLFYRNFPDMASSSMARYQFYQANWKTVLRACMDDQLILADAEEKEIAVTDGDIREELENLFGPEVVLNLEKAGLTFEEVWDILKKELTVRRMTNMMVKAKAIQEVSPQNVRKAYDTLVKTNPSQEIWRYRILSIRSDEAAKNNEIADIAYKLLSDQNIAFETLPTHFQQENSSLEIKVSPIYELSDKDLSLSHKSILQSLQEGEYSIPLLQKGKKDNEFITRLFYLVGREMKEQIPLAEVGEKLQGELLQQHIAKCTKDYLGKLYAHFGITEEYLSQLLPDDFVPFSLKNSKSR